MYEQAGLLVAGPPIAFVGSVGFLAAGRPDSTLVMIALSLSNRALTFASDGTTERAVYSVSTDLLRGVTPVRHVEARQIVRVATFREASRGDESVVFQQFVAVTPGHYTLSVVVRDDGSSNSSAQQLVLDVPPFVAGSVSSPLVLYSGKPRSRTDSLPSVVANPRATFVFGRDTAAPLYVEAYGNGLPVMVGLTVVNDRREVVYRDSIALESHRGFASGIATLPIARIGVGRLAVLAASTADTMRMPLFVTFGETLGITSFEELLSYLRYYASAERLQALRDAAPHDRAKVWAEFWRSTDPNPATAEHEGLRDYFARVEVANQRFREEGGPGWLSDRGKVFITLGEPDEIAEQTTANGASRGRAQIWQYEQHHAQFVFVDQTGFGRWRLTPASEADFQQIARRERVH